MKNSAHSFSRSERLLSKHDFQSVFQQPFKVTQSSLLALFKPNQQVCAKLGIMAAKHIVKSAVDRNRIKRVIRESFRQHKAILKGFDIIVLLRGKNCLIKDDKKALRDDADKLWQRLTKFSQLV